MIPTECQQFITLIYKRFPKSIAHLILSDYLGVKQPIDTYCKQIYRRCFGKSRGRRCTKRVKLPKSVPYVICSKCIQCIACGKVKGPFGKQFTSKKSWTCTRCKNYGCHTWYKQPTFWDELGVK